MDKPGETQTNMNTQDSFWQVGDCGFLPKQPLSIPARPEWALLSLIASQIPTKVHCFQEFVLSYKNKFLDLCQQDMKVLSQELLEWIHSCLGFICTLYVRPPPFTNVISLPNYLAPLWTTSSELLSRKTMIDYADCVLLNWCQKNEETSILPFHPENIQICHTFTGRSDEEWFYKMHIITELAFGPVPVQIKKIQQLWQSWPSGESQHAKSLCQSLKIIADTVRLLHEDIFPRMKDGCDPHFFFHTLRHFFATLEFEIEGTGEKKKFTGPTGAQSSIIESLDSFFAITVATGELGSLITNFRTYAPPNHLEYLAFLKTSNIRTWLRDNIASLPMEDQNTLIDCYNECVEEIVNLRIAHLEFVEQYIFAMIPRDQTVQGSGGSTIVSGAANAQSPSEMLRERANQTRKARLMLVYSNTGEPMVIEEI